MLVGQWIGRRRGAWGRSGGVDWLKSVARLWLRGMGGLRVVPG